MIMYAQMDKFNIEYDEFQKEFWITSKNDGRPMIGSFETARDAIEFATSIEFKKDKDHECQYS